MNSHSLQEMRGERAWQRKSNRSSGHAAAWLAGAATLGAAAAFVYRRSRAAERAHPPMGRFVDVDGVRLHYLERGEGPPLVLLHGNGALVQDFELSGLIELAAQKYRVIVFDRPGYGYSGRPRSTLWTPRAQAHLLHHALQQIGASDPVILGHSWGALVATAMGLDFPDHVKGLVLMSGYYYPTARADVSLFAPPSIPIIGDVLRYTVAPLIGRALWPLLKRRLFRPSPIPEEFEEGFPLWMALRPSQLRAASAEAALMIPAAYGLQERYHELLMPVVILAGDGDRMVNTGRQSERLYRELPHSTFHVTRGAGHMLHHVVQDRVMAAIDEAATALGAVPVMPVAAGGASPRALH